MKLKFPFPRRAKAADGGPLPPMRPIWIATLGAVILLAGGLLIALLVSVWPAVEEATKTDASGNPPDQVSAELLGFADITVSPGTAVLILVVFAAGVGSFVHIATSFADYVGNRRFRASWTWWYLLRVFVGTSLALLIYFAFRGGFFTASTTGDLNLYGIAALSGLAGLFSKQATDKLEEVFTALLRPAPGKGDAQREDSLANPVPEITGVEPTTVQATAARTTVRLSGEGFGRESKARVSRAGAEAVERKTQFVSATELSVVLEADDVAEPGTIVITVVNPQPGGGSSESFKIDVTRP